MECSRNSHIFFIYLQLSAKAKAAMANVPLPPIRNKVEIEKMKEKKKGEIFAKEEITENSKKVAEKAAPLKRDITPMFDYYKAWDKFAKKEVDTLNKKSDAPDDSEEEIIEAKNPVAKE